MEGEKGGRGGGGGGGGGGEREGGRDGGMERGREGKTEGGTRVTFSPSTSAGYQKLMHISTHTQEHLHCGATYSTDSLLPGFLRVTQSGINGGNGTLQIVLGEDLTACGCEEVLWGCEGSSVLSRP